MDSIVVSSPGGLAQVIADAGHALRAAASDPAQLMALLSAAVAALLVIVSAFVKTMIPLRWLAVGSNLGFMVYGMVHPNLLMLALHAVLLPVNLWRVWQMIHLTRQVKATTAGPQALDIWLRPYMRSQTFSAGQTVFASGDAATRLYFVADGEVELPEVGSRVRSGDMFGEIAFFSPDRRRTSSARCVTACTLLSMDEDTFKQLVHQNPGFGLAVVQLIAQRLTADLARLRQG
jgi:CRP/FNR family cyclic AMP-dependent transcriptional regulator